jgi:hypothetical protein
MVKPFAWMLVRRIQLVQKRKGLNYAACYLYFCFSLFSLCCLLIILTFHKGMWYNIGIIKIIK